MNLKKTVCLIAYYGFAQYLPNSYSKISTGVSDFYRIDKDEYLSYQVKRGLRNMDGSGVLAGLTNVSEVHGYVVSWPAIGEVTSRGATIVKAKIRIDDFPESILPNYSFTGKIQITEPVENLVVEKYAVAYENHEAYVETVSGKRINVKVQPYGKIYVKILEGLGGGEMLKAQSKPEESGFNRMRGNPGKNNKGGAMTPPPPGRF